MTGKWAQVGVPHRGWTCEGVDDLEEPSAICEMCEVQEIRYVHCMTHPDYPDQLAVGCICAGNMEEDYAAPRKRESILRNGAGRKARWLNLNWRHSYQGNDYIVTRDRFVVTIFPKPNGGGWGGCVKDQITQREIFARRRYETEDRAKLAALNGLLWLKQKREGAQGPRLIRRDDLRGDPR